jgi:hypothetical protein
MVRSAASIGSINKASDASINTITEARDFFAGDFKKAIDAKDWKKVRGDW